MSRPHLIYLAWGFPPAAKSCTYRMLATANSFVRSGWDVSVVTLTEDAWHREHGLDRSLLPLVDPRIEVTRLPLYREDLETDIRTFSRFRAQRAKEWLAWHRRADVRQFPEPVFGRWRKAVTTAAIKLHQRKPAQLLLTSASPYTFFAPALELYHRFQVPYVLDYRDAWAIDILQDKPAWEPDSRQAGIERELMEHAHEAWFVNTPIRDAYAALYPATDSRMHVVRNGSDQAIQSTSPAIRLPVAEQGLTFGYLGTITFKPKRTRELCEAWALAQDRHEVLARSRFVFRGHAGAGSARGASGHVRVINSFAQQGVSYGGPVSKGDTAAVYAGWDALVLCLVGGKYVTSGKVYDYISTGLPIMSAHEFDHAATEILSGYPLWVRNADLSVEALADAFVATAEAALAAKVDDHAAAREHANQFERYRQIEPAVHRLSNRFGAVPDDASALDAGAEMAADAALLRTAEHNSQAESAAPRPQAGGRRIVLACTGEPVPVVSEYIARMVQAGVEVSLLGPSTITDSASVRAASRYVTLVRRSSPVAFDRDNPPVKYSPAWTKLVATNLSRRILFKPTQKALGVATTWWHAVISTPAALQALDEAHLVVALDAASVYLCWQAAQRNRSAQVVNGIGPAMELLGLER